MKQKKHFESKITFNSKCFINLTKKLEHFFSLHNFFSFLSFQLFHFFMSFNSRLSIVSSSFYFKKYTLAINKFLELFDCFFNAFVATNVNLSQSKSPTFLLKFLSKTLKGLNYLFLKTIRPRVKS